MRTDSQLCVRWSSPSCTSGDFTGQVGTVSRNHVRERLLTSRRPSYDQPRLFRHERSGTFSLCRLCRTKSHFMSQVIGYSWQDTHDPGSANPGWGFDVAWRRFVLVVAGVFAAL
jgi:hypothetical protein